MRIYTNPVSLHSAFIAIFEVRCPLILYSVFLLLGLFRHTNRKRNQLHSRLCINRSESRRRRSANGWFRLARARVEKYTSTISVTAHNANVHTARFKPITVTHTRQRRHATEMIKCHTQTYRRAR